MYSPCTLPTNVSQRWVKNLVVHNGGIGLKNISGIKGSLKENIVYDNNNSAIRYELLPCFCNINSNISEDNFLGESI